MIDVQRTLEFPWNQVHSSAVFYVHGGGMVVKEEHPNVSAARISSRATIIVAVITAVSGWAVAGLSLTSSMDPVSAPVPTQSLQGDFELIEEQKTEIATLAIRLRCTTLELDTALSDIPGWKEYMRATAETYSNQSDRHSRTEVWFNQVDETVRVLQKAKQYASGQRQSC